ncbi:hypothetical protein D3C76_1632800 [compost metagenome]
MASGVSRIASLPGRPPGTTMASKSRLLSSSMWQSATSCTPREARIWRRPAGQQEASSTSMRARTRVSTMATVSISSEPGATNTSTLICYSFCRLSSRAQLFSLMA